MKVTHTLMLSLLLTLSSATTAGAEDKLKSINDANGGRIVYGQVEGQTTETGTMGAVLRSIHEKWGDEPQVGKFFRVRGTSSLATFLTGVNHTKGGAQWAGLVIVSQVSPDHVEAALLSDDAQRFGSNINPMLGELFRQWHPGAKEQVSAASPGATTQSSAANPDSATVATLHKVVLPDGSAAASLPDGWQVTRASGMGTIIAEGPNRESAYLGFCIRALNSNDPRVRRTMQFAQSAGGRNTSYAQALYYPYGGDLAKTFVDLLQMYRQKQGLPPAVYQIESQTSLPSSPGWRCAHLTGHMDAIDGVGMTELNSVFSCAPLGPSGGYMTYITSAAVPVQFADQERSTIVAILSSFSTNQQVVGAQAAAIAAPEIARIHEIGRRAAQQAASAHAAADAHNAAVERHWDANDKASQSFSNYLLDQTVIQDNKSNTHSTQWNQTADAMVRNNPQRYEYVETPNLRKGRDY